MTAPADWQGFAEMTGGASGALTGLLFVAVSLNASRIAGHQGLRASAAQTLTLFLAPLVMAAALLTPGQAGWVLGAELIAIGAVTSWILLSIRRVKHGLTDDKQLIAVFNKRGPNVMVMLLFVASGIILAAGASGGRYLLLPASLVALVSGVLNAWYFLLPPSSS
jgi:modulator of FtsH protease